MTALANLAPVQVPSQPNVPTQGPTQGQTEGKAPPHPLIREPLRGPNWAGGIAHEPLAHLSAGSRRDFVRFGFGADLTVPTQRLEAAFLASVAAQPEAVAVVDHEGNELTYRELDHASWALSRQLQDHGVEAGDRVGVFLSRSLELVVSILGVLRAGATWVPQDARISTRTMLEHIVQTADISVILTNEQCLSAVADLTATVFVPHTRVAQATGGQVADQVRDRARDQHETSTAGTEQATSGDDPAVIIFTSGTTGTPNGVQVSHQNLLNTILVGPASLGIQPGMRVAQLLNIAFDMSVWEIFGALLHGATLVIRGSDIEATAATCDVVIATPSVLGGLDPQICSGVQITAVAGERCPEDLAATWQRQSAFHNSCGPTEVTIVNTVHRLQQGDQLTIGAPIPNTSVYVLDEQLRPVETGEVGEMWAGGACVTDGYLKNPQLTEDRYRRDPFTGGVMFRCRDLVSWTPEGRLLHHGRTDDQVKVRGFRVELDAVTTAMEQADEVLAATTLFTDRQLVGALAVVGIDTPEVTDAADARVAAALAAIDAELPYYYQPERFVLLPKLPTTARGKVDKRAISAHLCDRSETHEPVAA